MSFDANSIHSKLVFYSSADEYYTSVVCAQCLRTLHRCFLAVVLYSCLARNVLKPDQPRAVFWSSGTTLLMALLERMSPGAFYHSYWSFYASQPASHSSAVWCHDWSWVFLPLPDRLVAIGKSSAALWILGRQRRLSKLVVYCLGMSTECLKMELIIQAAWMKDRWSLKLTLTVIPDP